MRIIGGRMRGLGLTPVGKGDASAHLRPTTDRVRESLFNLLDGGRFGAPVAGSQVLDLFAGTGALGLEALSRGASYVTFVDNGKVGAKLLASNIAKAKAADMSSILHRDATRLGACTQAPHDLVFLDPPYGSDLGAKALVSAAAGAWIEKDALIVWEDNSEAEGPTGFRKLESRRYGETWLTLLNYDG